MGQAKYNPRAIAAKEGKMPPKEPKMSKRKMERQMMDAFYAAMYAGRTRKRRKRNEP